MEIILDIIRRPIAWILRLCYSIVPNYMVALLLFAIIMQILLLPFAIKQQKNSIKQASLAPKIAALRKKYAGRSDQATQQKMQQEQMELYQKENYSMFGGCLPLLIQMPILLALFRVITQPLRYLCNMPKADVDALVTLYKEAKGVTGAIAYPEIEAVTYLKDLGMEAANKLAAGIESFSFEALPDFKMFGGSIDLSLAPRAIFEQTGNPLNWMILIPVVTVIALIFSQWLTKKFTYQAPEAQDAQNNCSMKVMMYSLPLMSGYFAYMYAAAIDIYWIFRNLLSLLQQILLAKLMPLPKFTEEDYKAAEKEMLGSNRSKKAAKHIAGTENQKRNPKSLHYIDADDDDDYVSDGKVTRYDEDDTPAEKPSGVPSSVVEAPMKDDKNKTYKKK